MPILRDEVGRTDYEWHMGNADARRNQSYPQTLGFDLERDIYD